jgi:IPT/TIG domain
LFRTSRLLVGELGRHAKSSKTVTDRINATSGSAGGVWILPAIASIAPSTAKIGSSFTLTINGSNFQGIGDVEFRASGSGMGGGMMGGGMATGDDPNIKVTNIKVNTAGTQVTASVQILSTATPGTRQIRLGTDHGDMMGPVNSTLFTATQ